MNSKIKFLSLVFIVIFSLSTFTSANSAVEVTKTIAIGSELSFSDKEILSSIENPSKVDGIILCELPDPSIGVLKFGTRDLLCGEAVTVEGIDSLRFIPTSESLGKTHFSCIPVYRSGKTDKPVSVAINVLSQTNHAPNAEDFDMKTARNIPITGVFRGTDPEKDELTYSVVEEPKLGNVEICLDAKNRFIYTPYQNKTGKDSFKYISTDKFGNASSSATVIIEIDNSKIKLTYADMENDGLHYQAIALAENGIYKGETIGDQNYLHPDLPVTRSEFIAMAMALYEKEEIPAAVSATNFADDASIPVWAKPVVSAATQKGLINGTTVNGKQYLCPNQIIIRSEAAVILNNVLCPEKTEKDSVFSDIHFIPAWAKQATNNIVNLNVMPQFSDSTIRPTAELTRKDAVELIYNAMCALK